MRDGSFHVAVTAAFAEFAAAEPERFRVVDASGSEAEVTDRILTVLADLIGTSVAMIEKHYGHVNTIRHADRVLMGMEGWNPVDASPNEVVIEGNAKDREAAKANQAPKAPSRPKR